MKTLDYMRGWNDAITKMQEDLDGLPAIWKESMWHRLCHLRSLAGPISRPPTQGLAEQERFVCDRVTTVLAVLSGAPMDNLTEDLQGIVKHWQKNISHRIQQQAKTLRNMQSRDRDDWCAQCGRMNCVCQPPTQGTALPPSRADLGGDRLAFKEMYKGFVAEAYWGDGPDARVVVTRDGQPFKEFKYPAYKIFNIQAHWMDIVEGELENLSDYIDRKSR